MSVDTIILLSGVVTLLSMLGIGKTILACGVANGMYTEHLRQPVTFGRLVSRHRLGAVIGLALLMIIPSMLSTLLGWIGGLFALLWIVAPAAMFYEGLGPWAAVKRSFALVRPRYSALLNTIVPLWVIGWLVVGTPLFGGLWLLTAVGMANSTMSFILFIAASIIGQICVAPLTAFGAVSFYLYIGEHLGASTVANELVPVPERQESIDGAG